MAVCEIWDVRGRLDHPIDYAENPEKTANPKYTEADLQAMVDVMEYATNKDKTEQRFFVTGVNCDPTTARDEMMITKAGWSDTSEIVCYHGFQSFKHGEVTPEQAHEVGVKLAERMWGDRFQVIVATHLNTDCLHNHFVVNSVSFADGMHYHDNKANLRLLRQRSDELCREYALSVIEHPSGKKKPYALYQAEKQGRPTRDNVARQAVDEAISKSFTLKDFDRQLAEMGYRINFDPDRKYWTIIGKGWQRPKRLYKLGEEYTNDRIMERISENSYAVKFQSFSEPQPQVKVYRVKGSLKNAKKIGGLRGLYLHYCYKLGKHAWTNKDGTYKEVYYYICGRNKQERGHYCEYKASLRKTDIEPLVIEAIRELVSDKSFAKEIKKRFGVQTDTSKIDKELANYESKLKEVDLNKARLEREIDNLPADAKYRERKIHDMTIRLDGLYDTIVELEERIEDAKLRRSSIEMEAITLENVYRIMANFSKLYAIISDEEKKSLVSYLIKEIQIYPNGTSDRILKSIEFNFPIYRDGREIRKLLWENGTTVETVCLLSRKDK